MRLLDPPPALSLALLSLFAAGCLPSSCNREEARELFPSDSLSRAFAASTPVDTLTLAAEAAGEVGLEFPRSIVATPRRTFLVGDVGRNELVEFDTLASVVSRSPLEAVGGQDAVPYVAGFSGDTAYVFFAATNVVVAMLGDSVAARVPLVDEDATFQLRYVAADKGTLWVKSVDPEGGALLSRYDPGAGRMLVSALRGAYWTHAGPLRATDGAVYSIRGYVPALDRIDRTGRIDSLALFGFDSPMLARYRSFSLGQANSPPLLVASAAIEDGRYFVLNVRPGWLRVDVFDGDGRLLAALTEPDPSYNKAFYPTDIAVVRTDDGYVIAVTIREPSPTLRLYKWWPDGRPRPGMQ